MDVEQLHVVLQQSFSADASVRHPAEQTIKNLKNIPGSVQLLLRVAHEKQVRFEVRQAAAIQLKNLCREGWAERVTYSHFVEQKTQPSLLSDSDKEAVKQGIIPALLDEPEKSVRDLYTETLHTILLNDFPEKWPTLIPFLLTTIEKGVKDLPNNGLHVHNALLALRKVCKRYEYKSREQRGPLNMIVEQSFPLLLPLAQQLWKEHSLEAAMMLKQILKIFWSSTQFYLPGADDGTSSIGLAKPAELQPWFDILTETLKKPLPEASTGQEPRGQPVEESARNAWPWWKVKKWTVQIMSRLFSRYGVPSYADDEPAKEFALYFSQHVAPQFMGPVFETLSLRPSGQFCTDRVVHLCIGFVALAVELSSTYKLLKPYLDFILYQVCFPTICLTSDDVECFENDPIEFVHKQNSPLADFYDPRMSAIGLITDLVSHRGQDVTQGLLSKMTEAIHRYSSSGDDQKNHIEKDGALYVFGSLSKYLLASEKYSSQIEGLLVSSVFPDFTSPVAFLRYRACWMVQQFSKVKWSDNGENLRSLLEMILNRLQDPALPVQIEASKALRYLVDTDGSEATLLPVLPQLLTEYFRIMNEIGNEEVVSALQALLDRFGDHIEPHAAALVTQLSNTFSQYCTAGEDEEDDEAALAASQCLECIATVMKGICHKESMIKTLEPLVIPLVLKILGNDGDFIEYLENALDILTFLTFFQSEITSLLWQVFPLVYMAFDQWAYDYLNMMVPCVQSYIQKSPDVFLTSSAQLPEGSIPYIDLVVSMTVKTITNDRSTEQECQYALSLFMCILHNCHGRIDSYIAFMNEIILGKLGQQVNSEVPYTRISIYQVIGSALYYNPQLELLELEKRGVTNQVFSQWLKDVPAMNRWLSRKMTVIGFASILSIPFSSIPSSLAGLLPQAIAAAVHLSNDLKEELASGDHNEQKSTDGERGIDDDVGDLDNGFAEDEDVTNEVDEAYRMALKGFGGANDGMDAFLMGDWEEDGEDIDENYTSPLDQVDELIWLTDSMRAASQREPENFQKIQTALPPESITLCQKLFAAADSMRAQAAQQSQQQT